MNTSEKTGGAAQGTVNTAKNNAKTNQTVNRPSIPGKDKNQPDEPAKNEPAKGSEAAPSPSAETKTPADQQEKSILEQPKSEEVKTGPTAEVRYIKPSLNLEQTLKAVEGLHRKG